MNTIQTLPENLYRAAYEVISPRDPETGKRTQRDPFRKASRLPILTHILVTVDEGRLALYTHDMETALVYHASARVNESFSTCVPGKPFLAWMEIIKSDGEAITLTHDTATETLHIYAGNAHAVFKCMAAAEFPSIANAIQSGTAPDPVTVTTALACDKTGERPFTSLHHVGGMIVGTDGRRIHTAPSASPDDDTPTAQVIAKFLSRIKAPTYTAIVTGAALAKSARSLSALAKRGDGYIALHCNGAITLTATAGDDTASTDVPLLNSTGGAATFTIPLNHLMDALAHVDPKQPREKGRPTPEPRAVTIRFLSWDAPIIIQADDRTAYIQPKTELPADLPKPTKSELMSAYNRKRAEYRKAGRSTYDLNRAFGKLQSRAWNVGALDSTAYHLLVAVTDRRSPVEIALPVDLDTVVHP